MSGETLSGGTVSLPVKPDTKGFGSKLSEGIMGESGGIKGLGAKLGGMLVGGLALVGVGASIGEVFKTGFDEAKDASGGMVQLAAGIKSTGNAANVSVNGMENLASSIQGMSGQTDDSIVKAEQLMLTFTNIKNVGPDKIFDQATLAAANMAAKLGGDASSQAILLGKALNDPVKGITALTRVGVSFTAAQKDQIAAMVKTGDTIGAQKVILKELNTEFGGAAAAAGQSLPGSLARTKRAFEDISQTIVESFMPIVAPAINGVATALTKAEPAISTMANALSGFLGAAARDVTTAFHELVQGFKGGTDEVGSSQSVFAKFGDALYWAFQSVKPALAAVMTAFKNLAPTFEPLIPQVLKLASAISPFSLILHAILPVLPQLVAGIAPLVAMLGSALAHALSILLPVVGSLVKVLITDLAGVFKTLVPIVLGLVQVLGPILGQILKALAPAIGIVATFLGEVIKVVAPLIPVVLQLVAALLPLLAPLLQLVSAILVPLISLFTQLLKPILDLATSLLTLLMPIITVLIQALAAILPPVLTALMPLIGSVASIFGDILGPAIHGITQILGGVIDFLTGVFTGNWSKIWKGISEVFSGIWNGLTGIVKGVVNGIIDLIDGVIKGVNSIGGAVGIKIGVIPHLAEGATVMPTPGGTIVRVAEAGKPESVVDTGKLNKLLDQATDGGSNRSGGGNTFNIYEAVSAQATAMQVARRQAAFSA